jgi:hypothetical protein
VPQNRQLRFGDLGLKITATVSWFGPQKQWGLGLSVAPQNQRREVGMGHASRSSGLLCVKASLARVSQSGLKTGGRGTAGGTCGTIVRLRRRQIEDGRVDAMGCIRLCYLTFPVFNVLGPRGIVVI